MKVMAPATTTTTTWLSVVVRVCANGGHVACWFVSQHTQTGGEHLSCDGRADGRAEEGRTNTQPRVGEREAADAWNDEASPAARRLQRQRKDCLRLTARLRRTRWYFDQFSDGGDDCGDGCCGNGCDDAVMYCMGADDGQTIVDCWDTILRQSAYASSCVIQVPFSLLSFFS